MTQEDKQLLLKDLCTRLPYGVMIQRDNCFGGKVTEKLNAHGLADNETYGTFESLNYKPYLRPMSSMTEEEKEELKQEHVKDEKLYAECLTKAANGDNSMRGKVILHFAADWCNKNHFDYRGLIEKGLALEAPEGMYKIE